MEHIENKKKVGRPRIDKSEKTINTIKPKKEVQPTVKIIYKKLLFNIMDD